MISFQGPQKLYEKGNDELYALVLPFNKFYGIPKRYQGFVQFQFIE
jgi:hypothetical protein